MYESFANIAAIGEVLNVPALSLTSDQTPILEVAVDVMDSKVIEQVVVVKDQLAERLKDKILAGQTLYISGRLSVDKSHKKIIIYATDIYQPKLDKKWTEVTIGGRLTKDPEDFKFGSDRTLSKVSLAVNRKQAHFFDITLFDKPKWFQSAQKGEFKVIKGSLKARDHQGRTYIDVIGQFGF
ncbi:MAG: single-stranded DNA-binding protein [Kangiellaceae bacterium]|jgi:hypothetical protein|nr:single-stranded DNA-binding protein [Kangiellaceae bacterium]